MEIISYLYQPFHDLYKHIDDWMNAQCARYQQVQKRRYGDCCAKYLVRRIQWRKESSWYLSNQITPEKRRVQGTLCANCPVEPESVIGIVEGSILHGHLRHSHVTPHTEWDYKSWKELSDSIINPQNRAIVCV